MAPARAGARAHRSLLQLFIFGMTTTDQKGIQRRSRQAQETRKSFDDASKFQGVVGPLSD